MTGVLGRSPRSPELREELEDESDIFSIYILFSELEEMVGTAHRDGDDDMLRRIYGYASWARGQPDDDIQNAAGVSFYEHLFDQKWMRPLVIPWIDGAMASRRLPRPLGMPSLLPLIWKRCGSCSTADDFCN